MFSYQLNKNEELVKIIRRHPLTFFIFIVKSLLVFAVLGGGGFFAAKYYRPEFKEATLLAGLVISLLYCFYQWLHWGGTVQIITTTRIIDIHQKSLFNKIITEIQFSNIHDILYEIKGVVATLLKSGNVIIKTGEGTLIMENIYKPAEIYKILVGLKNKHNLVK